MTLDQGLVLGLLAVLLGLLIWGRWRYDVAAFAVLLAAVLFGIVPATHAFDGFGHPATITVALVLVISRILADSGATDALARLITPLTRSTSLHAGALAGIGAAMSGFMNNVGTLALLMPLALQTASKAKRAAGLLLMPLSFGTILGGLVTLIGTPPNIIIATIRAETLGAPFGMFDFTPVGGLVAVAGLLFLTFAGWRLVPRREGNGGAAGRIDIESYLAEAEVAKESASIGATIAELYEKAGDIDVQFVGIIRGGHRLPARRREEVGAGDMLLMEVKPDEIEKLAGRLELTIGRPKEPSARLLEAGDSHILEAVVRTGARIEGRSVEQLRLASRFGVALLGVARRGQAHRGRLKSFRFKVGDVLLLHGGEDDLSEALSALGLLPLAERGLSYGQREKAAYLVGLFAAAIAAAAFGLAPIHITLGLAIAAMVATNLVPLRGLYDAIDGPVIVLLGSLIPVGDAMQATGATGLIAEGVVALSATWPIAVVLTAVLIVTMTLSDILNNAATAVVMAPIAIGVAERLHANPDAFLMAVAVGASCAFLTPVGHQNNALILGPGGYRFGDYWRLGLPLEILIVAVAVPAILWFWPV